MSFATVLDAYCNSLGCTNKDIALQCGLSPSTLSRYRNGERTPEIGSGVIDRLVIGIAQLSGERGVDKTWREEIVRSALEGSLHGSKMLGMSFGERLTAIMDLLGIRNFEAAQALRVSPSYVSRIRNGQRMPSGYRLFAERFADVAAKRCLEMNKGAELMSLVDSAGELSARPRANEDSYFDLREIIVRWLLGNDMLESDLNAIEGLFAKLNDFYFNKELEHIANLAPRVIEDSDLVENSRFYYGVSQMQEAELAFFDISAQRGAREVFLSSDMPLIDMTVPSDFVSKYRSCIGALIQRGARITVIHSLERPVAESVMAFELWLPLYITGQATPQYLQGLSNQLFFHVNYVSDVCALSAEAVMGHQTNGRYYLTTKAEDLDYYYQKMNFIMEHVSSFLDIYRESNSGESAKFKKFISTLEKSEKGTRIGADRYENLRIMSYPSNIVVTALCDPAIHFVIRHPKLRYAVSHMS